MAFHDIYKKQVELLVRALPYVAKEDCFALKGGTAINLFVRNLPRLSVDIDLTFLPRLDRNQALAEIEGALKRIAKRLKQSDASIRVAESAPKTQPTINKLVLRATDRVQIKIEVTPVLRGSVYKPEVIPVVERVEAIFGFAEMNVLSFADLYAGKIMAALARQHPRDLFDVHHLLTNEGIGEDLRIALIIYLISHDQSPHTLLSPRSKDISREYQTNFIGMIQDEISLETLLEAREALVTDIVENMPDTHKEFLLSFYSRQPKWELLGVEGVQNLPAVKWREVNLDRAGPETRVELVEKLEEVLTARPESTAYLKSVASRR